MSRFLFIAIMILLLAVPVACTYQGISDNVSDNATAGIADNVTDSTTDNQTATVEPRPVPEDSIPRISIDELKQKINSGDSILIVDTRHREEYEVDHIEGAVSAPLDDIISGKWQPPPDKELILYCG